MQQSAGAKRRRAPNVAFAPVALPPVAVGRHGTRSSATEPLAAAVPAEPPAAAGEPVPATVLVQFRALGTEEPTGPTLDVPTNVTPKQLEVLLNQLLGADEPTPYSFYLNDEEILGDLAGSLTKQALSGEEIHCVRFQPLAVFRVAPVTRCTDSLPGHTDAVLHISFRWARALRARASAHDTLSFRYSPDGTTLASGGGDATVTFWDASCFAARYTCAGHRHHVLCTAWSPDGKRFASADKSGEVGATLSGLWDAGCRGVRPPTFVSPARAPPGSRVGPGDGKGDLRAARGAQGVGDVARVGAPPPVRRDARPRVRAPRELEQGSVRSRLEHAHGHARVHALWAHGQH